MQNIFYKSDYPVQRNDRSGSGNQKRGKNRPFYQKSKSNRYHPYNSNDKHEHCQFCSPKSNSKEFMNPLGSSKDVDRKIKSISQNKDDGSNNIKKFHLFSPKEFERQEQLNRNEQSSNNQQRLSSQQPREIQERNVVTPPPIGSIDKHLNRSICQKNLNSTIAPAEIKEQQEQQRKRKQTEVELINKERKENEKKEREDRLRKEKDEKQKVEEKKRQVIPTNNIRYKKQRPGEQDNKKSNNIQKIDKKEPIPRKIAIPVKEQTQKKSKTEKGIKNEQVAKKQKAIKKETRVTSRPKTMKQIRGLQKMKYELDEKTILEEKLNLSNFHKAIKLFKIEPKAIFGGFEGKLLDDRKNVEINGSVKSLESLVKYVHVDLLGGTETKQTFLDSVYFVFEEEKRIRNAGSIIAEYLSKKESNQSKEEKPEIKQIQKGITINITFSPECNLQSNQQINVHVGDKQSK